MSDSMTPEKPHLLTRRNFLKLAVVAGAGAVILPKIPDFLKKKLEAEETEGVAGVSTEDLKREVESQFGIEITGPSSGIKEVGHDIGREYPTIEWDNLSLASLRSVLSQLPRHFYASGSTDEKEKVQFTLINTPLHSEKEWEIGICFCSEAGRHRIVLTRGMLVEDTKAKHQFTLAELGGPTGVLAHELTHSITARDMNKFIKAIIEPLDISEEGIQSFFSSEFEDPFHHPILGPFPMDKDGDYNDYYEKKDDYITIDDKFIVSNNDFFTLGGKYFREHAEDIWKRYSQTLTQERLEKGGPFWTYRVTSHLQQTKTRLGHGA